MEKKSWKMKALSWVCKGLVTAAKALEVRAEDE
jgi:hypothetical protein